jgi:predicted membrane-bound dolichyl-phosphate-mannose-protein mannosyltransferase
MKKEKNKFGLIKGFARRLFLLTLVYITIMVSIWSTLAQFFQEGVGFNWIFWLVISITIILWLGLVVWVEHAQLKRYGHD